MENPFMPTYESVATANTVREGPSRAEANWIVSRPEFEASARLKSLLLYLASRSDDLHKAKITQCDIARDVMDLGPNYDPSCDAHVRIEVSRLRSALCGFYSRLDLPRARRLSIPKGGYRTELEVVQQYALVSTGSSDGNNPIIALGTLCTDDHLSRRTGFEIECELLTLISDSAFMSDELLSFRCVEGDNMDLLVRQAEQLGACLLLVTRVVARGDGLDAYLSIVNPWDQRIISNIRLWSGATGRNSQETAQAVSLSVGSEAVDPIDGRVLQHVFRMQPQSRISRLSAVFNFMSSQNRSLLPAALAAAQSIAHSSNVARALTIDMLRASYCFATDSDVGEMNSIGDAAEALIERSPKCVWSNLALGYAGISTGRHDLVQRAITVANRSTPIGSQKADLKLLKSISEPAKDNKSSKLPSILPEDHSVFDSIRFGYSAVRDGTYDFALDNLQLSPHKKVFWNQAFQISAFSELGKRQKAREVFGQMKKAHPGTQDYMHRAVSTMISDTDLREKMLFGLANAAH